ncbi:hypothetical protein N0V94_008250 [Neodidymelliopsis sp. IMI 364377]|nr:hypothetical protein N0V94_008250 [Neodidymelliopsis sp. IMI 364377]
MKEEESNTTKVSLPDREPCVFQIFVQWLYFDTIPDRLGLSRLSTGKSISNSFLLWTLGNYLQADTFKNRIMHELCRLDSLDGYTDVLRFVEFTAAEVDYCWSQTMPTSNLRGFVLDTLAQHIVYGNYICMDDDKDWAKVFTKHADLQPQILAEIARSFNMYDEGVAKVLPVDTYLEVVRLESQQEEMSSQA